MKTSLTAFADWPLLARKALNGEQITLEEGLAVLEADNDELLAADASRLYGTKTFLRQKSEAEYDYQR